MTRMESGETTPLLQGGHETSHVVDHVTYGRWRKLLIIPVLFVFVFAHGMSMYWTPQYVQHVVEKTELNYPADNETGNSSKYDPCKDSKSGFKYERYLEEQRKNARWTLFIAMATYIPAIFTNIMWGSISDRYGRRLTLSISSFGLSTKFILTALVVYFDLSLVYLIVASCIDGCTGTFSSLVAVTFSYVSDLTEAGKQRTLSIVLVEVFISVASTVASFLSGTFIEETGFFYPMLTVACFTIFGFVIILIFLPETLSSDSRESAKEKSIFSIIMSAGKFYVKQESRAKQLKYIFLILSFALFTIPYLPSGTLETIYQIGTPFCWSPSTIGIFAGLKSGLGSSLAGLGAYLMQKCLADDTVAVVGFIFRVIACTVEGLAQTTVVLFTVPVINALSFLPIPLIRGLMSQLTDASNQGALFAGIAAVETLCRLIGYLTSNLVYSATVAIFNGFVFIIGAIITLAGMLFLLCFMYIQRRGQRQQQATVINEETISSDEMGNGAVTT